MDDILISVIVPVYNAEAYITQCVQSILKQTHRNLELLLIVDGATDRSLALCRELEAADARIAVVDKPNEGVAATRNLGIAMAKGQYICFIDSDDTVSEQYVERLLQKLQQEAAQLALCHYAFVRKEGIVPSGEPTFAEYCAQTDSLYDSYIRPLFSIDGAAYIMGSACRSMISRELLISRNIVFPPCRIFEDQLFMMAVMGACSRITAVNDAMYFYNDMVTGSALRAKYKKNLLEDQLKYLHYLKDVLQQLPIAAQQQATAYAYGLLNVRKLLLTNAAMNPDAAARKGEIAQIRASSIFDERIGGRIYFRWLVTRPKMTMAAELLLQLRMYGVLRKLRGG